MQTVVEAVVDLQPALTAARKQRLVLVRGAGMLLAAVPLVLTPLLAISALGSSPEAGLVAALAIVVILLAQAVAHRWSKAHLERIARPLLGEAAALLPLIEPHSEPVPPEQAAEETVEQMVEAGEKAGLIQEDEHEMITGVLGLDRTYAREIMVPRIDVVAIEAETPLQGALDVVIEGAHSRVPVYEESIDHVIGLLYAKDLLRTLRDGKGDLPLRSLLRPAHFVPESKRVDELLQDLQQSKVHMAIVVDEYGGTAGIVTIEDVLEEIVGDIQDEYDIGEEPLVERLGENEGVFNARVNIDEVNDALSLDLPDESDTLGGLVYQHLQKMPRVGDQVRVDGVVISVLSVVGRRIKKVRVAKVEQPVASEQ